MSYLFVRTGRTVVPDSETSKMYEAISRLLLRELSEALNQPIKILEKQILKSMRSKLLADQ
jgi:hypothetical protein